MNQSSNIIIIAVVVGVIGLLISFKLDLSLGTAFAAIRYGDWEQMTFEDGTIHNADWIDFEALPGDAAADAAKREYETTLQQQGITASKISGYGLKVSRKHTFSGKVTDGTLHVFDSERAAVRFAKEIGIPDHQIHISNRAE